MARAAGYEPLPLGDGLEGEAIHLAERHAERALNARAKGEKLAIISGGEAAVTFTGTGPGAKARGGPNQEYALALAIALNGAEGISALAADTEGIDGGTGAACDPAGAFVMPDTLKRASERGLDAKAALERHDSGTFFAELDDLLKTGPSYTNVNDFRAILVESEI